MVLRAFCVRFVGGVAHIRKRTAKNADLTVRRMGRTIPEHHLEINQVLDVLQSVGEAANIGPLKGVVGIVRMIISKAQAMKALSDTTAELTLAILDQLRCIANVFTQYPAIIRCLVLGQQPFESLLAWVNQYELTLRQILDELEQAGQCPKFWRQSLRTTQLASLQRHFTQCTISLLTHCALVTTFNSVSYQPPPVNPVPNETRAINHHRIAGVPELEHITDIIYRHDISASGFFRDTYVGEVKNVGNSLVKRVPRGKANTYRKLVSRLLTIRHPNLPQLAATFTCPQSFDLFLVFHCVGQEYIVMSVALRIGCDFWPGGHFYRTMGHCWQVAEKFLSNHQLKISPSMVQAALIDGRGNLIFSLPDREASISHQGHGGLAADLAQESGREPEEHQDNLVSIVSEHKGQTAVTMMRLSQVRKRIDYLAIHEQAPTDDTIPVAPGSILIVQADIPGSYYGDSKSSKIQSPSARCSSTHESNDGMGADGETDDEIFSKVDVAPCAFTCEANGRLGRTKDGKRQRKMHGCPHCGKQFPRPSGLDIHTNTVHSGRKPYGCPVQGCNKFFAVRSNMTRHLKTHGAEGTAARNQLSSQAAGATSSEVQRIELMLAVTEPQTIPSPTTWSHPMNYKWSQVPGSLEIRTNIGVLVQWAVSSSTAAMMQARPSISPLE